jgi:hypothetical protein
MNCETIPISESYPCFRAARAEASISFRTMIRSRATFMLETEYGFGPEAENISSRSAGFRKVEITWFMNKRGKSANF